MFSWMIVKPKTGVTVCGPGVGRGGTTRFRSGRRISELSPRRAGRRSKILPALKSRNSCSISGRQAASGGRPLGGFEARRRPGSIAAVATDRRRRPPAARWQRSGGGRPYSAMSRSDRCSARTRLRARCAGPTWRLRIARMISPSKVSRNWAAAMRRLRCMRSRCGRAHLADPAILQDRQRRQQDEQRRRHERRFPKVSGTSPGEV